MRSHCWLSFPRWVRDSEARENVFFLFRLGSAAGSRNSFTLVHVKGAACVSKLSHPKKALFCPGWVMQIDFFILILNYVYICRGGAVSRACEYCSLWSLEEGVGSSGSGE